MWKKVWHMGPEHPVILTMFQLRNVFDLLVSMSVSGLLSGAITSAVGFFRKWVPASAGAVLGITRWSIKMHVRLWSMSRKAFCRAMLKICQVFPPINLTMKPYRLSMIEFSWFMNVQFVDSWTFNLWVHRLLVDSVGFRVLMSLKPNNCNGGWAYGRGKTRAREGGMFWWQFAHRTS